MNVAVIGRSTPPLSKTLVRKTAELGRVLALNKHVVLTGACNGFPQVTVEAAYALEAKTIGYSPATDRKEHVEKYGFPIKCFTQLRFYGNRDWSVLKNFSWRSAHLIDDADAVLCVEGSWGTLGEIASIFWTEKPFGVLETGGASSFVKTLEKKLAQRRKRKVVYDTDPKRIVNRALKPG